MRVTNDEAESQILREKLIEVLKGEKARELFNQPFSEIHSKYKGKEESIADSIA